MGELYREEAGEGPAVVLVHEAVCDSRMWDPQWRTFPRSYRTVRYDQRGFGRSELRRIAEAESIKRLIAGSTDGMTLAEIRLHLDLDGWSNKAARQDLSRQAAKSRARGGKPGRNLEDRTRQDLYEVAKRKGIPGRSSMGKWDLIEAIRKTS